jgi:membrane protease YdiL (CAAX protease family)
MNFTAELVLLAISAAATLLWARWSKLDLALRRPVLAGAWPWAALFVLWCAVETFVVAAIRPVEVDAEWLEEIEQLSGADYFLLTVVLDPLWEELFFRGAMFSALIRRWGIWVAALVPSLLWGLAHAQYEWWYMASIAGSGVVLAIVRWKSGSIWLPVGLHAAFNLSLYLPLPVAA